MRHAPISMCRGANIHHAGRQIVRQFGVLVLGLHRQRAQYKYPWERLLPLDHVSQNSNSFSVKLLQLLRDFQPTRADRLKKKVAKSHFSHVWRKWRQRLLWTTTRTNADGDRVQGRRTRHAQRSALIAWSGGTHKEHGPERYQKRLSNLA